MRQVIRRPDPHIQCNLSGADLVDGVKEKGDVDVTGTKRYPNPNAAPARRDSGSPEDERELQRRIACKGKTAPAVLAEVGSALADAASRQLNPLIVLEDLGLLQDSVATLIKGFSRLLVGFPGTVTFWESSGYTEAFLSVMEKQPG